MKLNCEHCDVAIIGAGGGGLVAAAILARAGLNCVVVEAEPAPGGYLAGFSRNNFHFDSSIAWISECGPTGFAHRLLRHIGEDFPIFAQSQLIHRFKGSGYDIVITSNPLELRDRMIADYPDDAEGIRTFFDDAEKLGHHLARATNRMRTTDTMGVVERAIYGLKMLAWLPGVFRYIRMPVEKGLKRYFKTEAVRSIFGALEEFMSVIVPFAWAFTQNYQLPPKGGGQELTDWLARKATSDGATIVTGRRVESIPLDSAGRATGVKLEGGDEISARYVVAASDMRTLYHSLLPPGVMPKKKLATIDDAELHPSSVVIYLGLDRDPRHWGFGEEVLTLTSPNALRTDHSSGDPEKTSIMAVAGSVRDPSMAPPGKGTLTLWCPARIEQFDRWKTGPDWERGEAYRNHKRWFTDIVIRRLEELFAPGLADHIETISIATPVTFWRYTANAEGTALGVKPSGKNVRAKVAHYRTPVPNLFIGGHWAEYAGGVPMIVKSGANAALLILQKENVKAFEELRSVIDNDQG